LGLFRKALGAALISQGFFGAAIFATVPGYSGLAIVELLLLVIGVVVITRK
jgi:hypothetical protein